MASSNSRADTRKLCNFIKQKLEEEGYRVRSGVTMDKTAIDLLATKDGKTSVIEVKTTTKGVLSSIPNLTRLKVLPEIDFIYIAAPEDVLTEDVFAIAKYQHIGIGLIVIADNNIKWRLKSREWAPPKLTLTSYSLSPRVFFGEIFDVKASFGNSGGKIAKNVEVACTPLGPFEPLTERIQEIKELPPGDRAIAVFKFKVEDEGDPGRYFIFMKFSDKTTKRTQILDIEVETRSSEYIERLVADAVAELDRVMSKNIEDLLRQIEDAVEKGYVKIEDYIYDKSIWNNLGMAYLNQGLLKQAELVYRSMLKSLRRYETTHDTKIHKGLAYHNLGIVLYRQGKTKEAKEMLLKAFEEDTRTYGPENAAKGEAKRALDELQFDPMS